MTTMHSAHDKAAAESSAGVKDCMHAGLARLYLGWVGYHIAHKERYANLPRRRSGPIAALRQRAIASCHVTYGGVWPRIFVFVWKRHLI